MMLNHFYEYCSVSVGARFITQCPILMFIFIPIHVLSLSPILVLTLMQFFLFLSNGLASD
jgi:hypothetical protein